MMESTRQTILNVLRRRRQATVEELTRELGLAPATIRRHLDILIRDGYVDVTQVRRQTGRPHYLFRLTEAGEDLFPKHYVRLTNRLIDEVVSLRREEIAGRSGRELADLVFERMARRLAQRISPRVHGSSLEARLESTLEALAEEGITFDVERRPEGYLLTGQGCPCPRTTEGQTQVCAHDQRLLSLLLDAEVTPAEPTDAVGSCAYLVKPRAEASAPAQRAEQPLPSQGHQV